LVGAGATPDWKAAEANVAATLRAPIADSGRIVVKVGSSSITSVDGGLDPDRLAMLVDTLATVRKRGADVVLVSSGAIAAGLAPLGLRRRPRDLATQQASASVGQGLLVARYTAEFARYGITVGQVLLTADDLTRRTHYRNAYRTLARLLQLGVMPVVNENDTVATDEIGFGDNDRLAALVAHLVHADVLLLLSDVDALYDDDPRNPEAQRVPVVPDAQHLEGITLGKPGVAGVGRGGMVSKVEAARIATSSGVEVVLTAAPLAGLALAGEDVGTWFRRRARRASTRHLWLAYAAEGRGRLVLDDGAVRAVVQRRLSLLPAGVVSCEGRFDAGDPVDLVDGSGVVLARGLVNYDSAEIPLLLGRSTRELAAELGPEYEREVVHRDDLVLLAR
jgi:glutamate 5-kinase